MAHETDTRGENEIREMLGRINKMKGKTEFTS